MHLRLACGLLACFSLAAAAPASAQQPVSVYGLELDVDEERERLLIFADAPLEPGLLEVDEGTLMVTLPGAALDPSAPTRLTPERQGTVRRVTAFDRAERGTQPEVRVVVQRRPGAPPRLERRAALIALDFEPLPGRAQAPADSVAMSYRDAPLARVVADIARATGETIVLGDAVVGSVSVEGPARVSRGEALALLDSLLLIRGLAAVPVPGGGRKVVQITGAEGPWVPLRSLPESEQVVATLLRLETVKADDVLAALGSFFGAQTLGLAHPPTNSLILVGPAALLQRVRTAVEALDRLDPGRLVVWRLQYADAATVAEQLAEIFDERSLASVSSNPANNTLLLRLHPDDLPRARSLVDRLDRPAWGRGELHVVPLQYADPVALAERLIALRDDLADVRDFAVELAEARRAGLRGREFVLAADVPTHSLVVQALPEVFEAVLDVVREIDRAPPSVRVDLTVASVVMDDRLDIGVDYVIPTLTDPEKITDPIATIVTSTTGNPPVTGPATSQPFLFGYSRSPIPLTLPILDPLTGQPVVILIPRESVSVQLNGREVRTETLMRPQLLLTGGDEHEIFAGDNIPIRVAQAEPGAPTEVRQDIQRQDVGTRVRLLPTLGIEGGVQLELELEQSELAESLAGDTAIVGPTIRKIDVSSRILLRHGETAVIATSAEPIQVRTRTGIPWLMDLPWLGWLFRGTSDVGMKRHLLIAVKAEIVTPESRELARALARELAAADAERDEPEQARR